jgi:NAD(P)H-quinone oxidoreductase subunit 4
MSGFVGELEVFLGFATSNSYTDTFKAVVVLLSAVGLLLTPIYLLSMLREMFYGAQSPELKLEVIRDAKPREVFITACLLIPVVGVGFYPKLLTQTYDVKTEQIAAHTRAVIPTIAQQPLPFFQTAAAPPLTRVSNSELLGIVK